MRKHLGQAHELMCSGLEQEIFTAATLLIIHHDNTVFCQSCGTVGGPGTASVTNQTIFDVASLTKILATTPVWMLLESESPGILDQPIARWFPDTPPDKAAITPRLLLAHASGLPAWRPYYLMQSAASHTENVRTRILLENLIYPPGRGSVYSDLGFILLGFIIEKETGATLAANARNRIYEPLGLSEIMFLPRGHEDRIAWTRLGDPPGVVNDLNARALGGVAGHAGLFATAQAAGRLALEVLRSYRHRGLFRQSITRTFCRRAAITPDSARALGFDTPAAQGSSCGSLFSEISVGHTGFTGVSLWIDLDREVIGVLFTNRVVKGESDFRIKDFRPMVYEAIMEAMRAG
jgi:CubicO group peptidase (beta-lactamase class C family)